MTLRRTLQRSLSTTTRGLSQFGSGGGVAPSYDTDAQTYITAVEAADGESLETGVKDAINAFVVGCKADGIWTAIKASCILAGARTLTGALVPLVGTAPTNNNFVSGDYSRTAGLTGDGSTKYLNTNRANNADPQNNQHMSVFVTTLPSSGNSLIGNGFGSAGDTHILTTTHRHQSGTAVSFSANTTGFRGISRDNSANYDHRVNSTTTNTVKASTTPSSNNSFVCARGVSLAYSNARIAFYSIGEALNLAFLDTRVVNLITAIGAAIP